jgi:AcrR family transcriptional regulator
MKVRTEAKREAILEEALRLFEENGYERATMSELTRRLGGSKATLYGYFPSKQDLFLATIESRASEHLAGVAADLKHLFEGDVQEGLTRVAVRMLTLLTQEESMAMQRIIHAEAGNSDVGEIFLEQGPQRMLNELSTTFRAAMDRDDMQVGPPDALALQFHALALAEIEMRKFMRSPPTLNASQIRAMAERAVRMFFGGYAAVQSGPPSPGAAG